MSDRLKSAIGDRRKPAADKVELEPTTAYEAVIKERLDQLAADVAKIESQVTGLLWAVIGAVVVGVVLQIGGW